MPLITKVKVARIEQDGTAEDAEPLLEWMLAHPKGKINLKYCSSLHSAIVQVLLALQPEISAWPENESLSNLLHASVLGNSSTTVKVAGD